ncbi:hypothetical protein ACFSHT_33325 [Paraburkholderia silviterrae]|uniref:hypothetical protein n=1 Tax=Paraburkholderia silviterrae TaxID=2528715 RepID=UPI0014049615|nr:hypothetical protein [Paraburkholderia silviterrae]
MGWAIERTPPLPARNFNRNFDYLAEWVEPVIDARPTQDADTHVPDSLVAVERFV